MKDFYIWNQQNLQKQKGKIIMDIALEKKVEQLLAEQLERLRNDLSDEQVINELSISTFLIICLCFQKMKEEDHENLRRWIVATPLRLLTDYIEMCRIQEKDTVNIELLQQKVDYILELRKVCSFEDLFFMDLSHILGCMHSNSIAGTIQNERWEYLNEHCNVTNRITRDMFQRYVINEREHILNWLFEYTAVCVLEH